MVFEVRICEPEEMKVVALLKIREKCEKESGEKQFEFSDIQTEQKWLRNALTRMTQQPSIRVVTSEYDAKRGIFQSIAVEEPSGTALFVNAVIGEVESELGLIVYHEDYQKLFARLLPGQNQPAPLKDFSTYQQDLLNNLLMEASIDPISF